MLASLKANIEVDQIAKFYFFKYNRDGVVNLPKSCLIFDNEAPFGIGGYVHKIVEFGAMEIMEYFIKKILKLRQ